MALRGPDFVLLQEVSGREHALDHRPDGLVLAIQRRDERHHNH